jgi:hypothetical protein
LVLGDFTSEFRNLNPGLEVTFRKFLPQDEEIFRRAPVKRLTLLRKDAPSDKTDRLIGRQADPIDIELSLVARRRRSLGSFASVSQRLRAQDGTSALVYDGVEFDKVTAEVTIGGRRRTVGVLGLSNQAGVIDLTSDIELGPDGHPALPSIREEVENILADFKTSYGLG